MTEVSKKSGLEHTPWPEGLLAEVPETGADIDLLELFFRLLERWKIILAGAVAGTIIMSIVSFFLLTPLYQATSKLYVMSSSDSAVNLSDLQIGSYLTSDYKEVFKTWEVHEQVIQNLELPYTYEELEEDILTISNPSDTRILYITATTDDPQLSTNIANEYALVARQYISRTMSTDEPNIMSVALKPAKPVKPNKTLLIILGFVLGGGLMMGIFTVRFIMDDKLKTADDISKYVDIPTLAIVPAGQDGAPEPPKPSMGPKSKKRKGSKP